MAYNGIQARAENTKTTQAVAQYVKGIQSYAALNDVYPVVTGNPCLGVHPGTTCANVTDSAGACNGYGQAKSTVEFDGIMKQIFNGSVPQPSTQSMNCGGKNYGGAFYASLTGKTDARIFYFLRGNQPCNGIGGLINSFSFRQDDLTICMVTFATI